MICLILLIIPAIVLWCNFGMQSLPHGDQITHVPSPNGDYVLTIYRCGGDATVRFSIRGAVTYTHWLGFTRNAYWQAECSNATVEWISPDEVKINGSVLNVLRDTIIG